MTKVKKPKAHAGLLAAVIRIAEETVGDIRKLLSANEIDPDIRNDPDAIVPINHIHGFLRDLTAECEDEWFLWHEVLDSNPEDFGFYGQLAVNARTLERAFLSIADNIEHLVSNSHVGIEERQDSVQITYCLRDPGTDSCRPESETIATFAIAVARHALGDSWMPQKIYFEHDQPPNPQEYGNKLLSRLVFGSSGSGILISKSDLSAKMPDYDVYLDVAVGHYIENVIGRTIDYGENALLVRRKIAPCLATGAPALGEVAQECGMSSRTMQRRLSMEGTCYSEVLEELRRDMAERLLSNNSLTITEVAYLLGYADLSSFDRAYRKWNGATPADARRSRAVPRTEKVTG